MEHTILSVVAKPANEAGALDGFEAICSCIYRFGSSLGEHWAAKLGREHAEYMNRKAARR